MTPHCHAYIVAMQPKKLQIRSVKKLNTMPKAKTEKVRQAPLAQSIEEGYGKLKRKHSSKHSRDDEQGEGYVDAASTRKILQLAKEQLQEINEENTREDIRTKPRDVQSETVLEEEYEVDEDDEENWSNYSDYEEYEELVDVPPEEAEILAKYGLGSAEQDESQMNLRDKIMEKIREMEMKEKGINPHQQEGQGVMLPPKVIEVYTQVGELLSRYRSGRLPRAFKIVPSLKNWKDVLYVTSPETWSNQALYEGTKLFVSNLQAVQSQWFIREVLLERFRSQVEDSKNVNYHVYRALKKALYKPAGFFKGFLFPLVESGTCTLREAVIASSILARVSIPALHSAAALLHLAEMDYSGPVSLFIKVLLDKKYALPYKVVDAMVFYFVRFRAYTEPLPVIWHQTFLVFAQRYKNDITEDQRDALLAVVRLQPHPSISPEIRRELLAGQPRVDETKMA